MAYGIYFSSSFSPGKIDWQGSSPKSHLGAQMSFILLCHRGRLVGHLDILSKEIEQLLLPVSQK